MKQIFQNLWQTTLEKPFGGVHSHAYYLKTNEANVLLYNTSNESDLTRIQRLGGVQYQLLSHRDETGASLNSIKSNLGASLCCHVDEAAAVEQIAPVELIFTAQKTHFAGLDVIHTPGHTNGSLSFVYDGANGKRYLFSGDTLFRSHGVWQTLVSESAGGSYQDLIDSLELYRELKPDVVFWSASAGDDEYYASFTPETWSQTLDQVIQKLLIKIQIGERQKA